MPQICDKCGALLTNFRLPLPVDCLSSSRDLTHLLASNEVPLDSDLPLIRDIISSGESRVDILSSQIHNLQVNLTQLLRCRDDTANDIHRHRAILSPIRHIPPELLCGIFLLTLDGNEDTSKKPPWYLGQICRAWRHSALSFPNLWSSITVPSVSSGDSGLVSLVEAQLLRSAKAPLDVYWRNIRTSINPHLAGIVLAHCGRWRSLCLEETQSSPSSYPLNWLGVVRGHLHGLERLETNIAATIGHVIIPDVFLSAPKLRQVYLTNERFGHPSPAIMLPWNQITHYRGKSSPQDHRRILADAPNLVTCTLTFMNFTGFSPNTTVTLPHLRCLSLGEPRFLLQLTAPMLSELVSLSNPPSSIAALLPFVQYSGCTLTKLVLMRCTIGPELISALRGLAAITYLLVEASNGGPHSTLFDAMTISGDPSDLCPNIRFFAYGHRFRDYAWDHLFAMVHSRFPSTNLAILRIFHDGTMNPPEAWARLQALRDRGLDAEYLGRLRTVRLLESVRIV
ncbi:hypothetical protein C8F04DRAFT_1012940 [Mycena alexandri]|uniref:F-box domain-containing protein n=1 Tax=Mycena alexandri TaxID=1745969 RepID=A0AAD6S676_9AGAR|nr:hypothetical protein C8F04DRAFT_1012940 [Mycena alexandri]